MKTKFKYIEFEQDGPDMERWFIVNRKDHVDMGQIILNDKGIWIVDIFYPNFWWWSDCLKELARFLDRLNGE